MPEISVIIPTYNPNIEYFKRSLSSVLNQTFKDFEIIIVDDGSDVALHESIEQIVNEDSRIFLLTQQNMGVSAARNNGIKFARGTYLAFVDDDDFVAPNFLEESRDIIVHEGCEMVIGGVIQQEEAMIPPEVLKKDQINYEVLIGEKCRDFAYAMLGNVRYISNKAYISRGPVARLVRKDVDNIWFPVEIKFGEDNIWNINLALTLHTIAVVDRAWYIYVKNNTSTTQRCNEQAIEEAVLLIDTVSKKLDGFRGHLKDYGDYVYIKLHEMCSRWYNNKECPLKEAEKCRELRSLSRREPWNVLGDKFYLSTLSTREKMYCFLFRMGLLPLYWKYHNSVFNINYKKEREKW